MAVVAEVATDEQLPGSARRNRVDVLLVDDDAELAALLADYLGQDGFDVAVAVDGESGVAQALSGRFEIVVLDVMMPGLGGIDALREIRAQSLVPVVMLTGRGDEVDRVVGLELGADDYVAKPCSPRELSARLRAILRRQRVANVEPTPPHSLRHGLLTLWPARRSADWNGEPLMLTAAEFGLLETLMRHAGQMMSREQLVESMGDVAKNCTPRSIDVHVSRIRHKIGQHTDTDRLIKTMRGLGYLFTKS